jgi:hypothetical protein
MTVTIRSAVAADLSGLPAIELSSAAMFAELGIVFPTGPATVEGAIVQGADILVAGEPPEGFAAVIGLDGVSIAILRLTSAGIRFRRSVLARER